VPARLVGDGVLEIGCTVGTAGGGGFRVDELLQPKKETNANVQKVCPAQNAELFIILLSDILQASVRSRQNSFAK
jgi:hypothetical protein